MSTETYEYEKINAKDKPVAEDFVYVYSEIEDGGFRKVSKAMLKVLLGVATKLSELENDKEFITKTVSDLENYYSKSDTYSKDEIDNRISLIPRFNVKVVSSLPTTDISETTVYLVSSGDDSDNLYTEYINVNGLWEILGTQKIASVENAVLYTAQTLTDEQKAQARTNINAASIYIGSGDMPDGYDIQIDPDGDISGIIPTYWQTAIDEAVAKVKELQNIAGYNCVNYVWFSDIHYNARDAGNQYTNELGNISAKIMNECNIPLAISTGDEAESGSAASETYIANDIKAVENILSPISIEKLLRMRGNHDDVWGSYASGDSTIYYVNKISPSKIWNTMHRKQMQDFRRVSGGDGTYFYVDNIPQKTRFICLNSHFYDGEEIINGTVKKMTTGFGIEQLEWLANVALPVDENIEKILIFTHVPPTASTINGRTDYLGQYSDGTDFRGIITAYCNASSYTGSISADYADKNVSKVVGIFCGHCHVDAIVTDDLPCPIITIRCASNIDYDTDVYPKGTRVLGSDNETALDIVTVDTKNGNIYMTRLGLGEDRVCNYLGEQLTTYTNMLDQAGYTEGYRISSSSGEVSANTATDLTGFIPCQRGDIIRLKNIAFPVSTANVGVHFYASDKTTKTYSFIANAWTLSSLEAVIEDSNIIQFTLPSADAWSEPGDFAYIRICASDINNTSIITVNEGIV